MSTTKLTYLVVEKNSTTAALYRISVAARNPGKKIVWSCATTPAEGLQMISHNGEKPDRIVIAGAEYGFSEGFVELKRSEKF